MKEITEDEFYDVYQPIQNHIELNAPFDGCMYETFGHELEHIALVAANSKSVWTILETECDGLAYAAGLHVVNRIGFFITQKPWKTGDELISIDTRLDEEICYE